MPSPAAGAGAQRCDPRLPCHVDPDTLGLSFEALVFITMRQEDRDTLMGLEEGVAAIPHVLQAQRLFGDPDYLLRIVTTGLAACQTKTLCAPRCPADDLHARQEASRERPATPPISATRPLVPAGRAAARWRRR